MKFITIKQLHATTGELVRSAGKAKSPIIVTDRGQPVAVIGNPALLRAPRRIRTLLPEFAALMTRKPGSDLQEDIDAVRAER